jgi:hypothetical protein
MPVAGSETIEVPASHAVYLSRPDEVARLIERAAKASAQGSPRAHELCIQGTPRMIEVLSV